MAAILSTLYLIVFSYTLFTNDQETFKDLRPIRHSNIWDNIRNIFHNTFDSFHNVLGLLSVSVCIASIALGTRRESLYDTRTSLMASSLLAGAFLMTLPIRMDTSNRPAVATFYGVVVFFMLYGSIVASGKPWSVSQHRATASRIVSERLRFEVDCTSTLGLNGIDIRVAKIFLYTCVAPVVFGVVSLHYSYYKPWTSRGRWTSVLWRPLTSIYFLVYYMDRCSILTTVQIVHGAAKWKEIHCI